MLLLLQILLLDIQQRHQHVGILYLNVRLHLANLRAIKTNRHLAHLWKHPQPYLFTHGSLWGGGGAFGQQPKLCHLYHLSKCLLMHWIIRLEQSSINNS